MMADVELTPMDLDRLLRLGAMVARPLLLFIDGKLEVAGLRGFFCSSRPLRAHKPRPPPAAPSRRSATSTLGGCAPPRGTPHSGATHT